MELSVKKILVPIAFSENCMRAKDFADAIAKQFGAEVELLHVVEASPYEVYQQRGIVADVPIYESALGSVPRSTQKYIVKDVMEETRNELDKIAATDGRGVKYVTDVKHGHSVDEILREQPDGLFISNGPGDPEAVGHALQAIRTLAEADELA